MQWLIDLVYARVMLHFVGIIVEWHDTIENIPTGWHLCDGTNGTPDMQDKFVVGANNQYDLDDTGGALTHWHSLSVGKMVGSGVNYGYNTNSKNHLPPYRALYFIQYIG